MQTILPRARPQPSATRQHGVGPSSRRWSTAPVHPLLPVLILAAALRFWNLSGMPVRYFDSGAYLGEGRFLASSAQRAADALFEPAPGAPLNAIARVVQAVETGTEGHSPDLAKPGHSILLALGMLVLGP